MTTDEVQPAPADGKKVFTLEECEKHIAEEDCWLVIHGKVYDVTEMLDEHPGGGDILVSASGEAQRRGLQSQGPVGSQPCRSTRPEGTFR